MFAIDFEVNGIKYYTSSLTNSTVKVVGKTDSYTGAIVIPESVSYQGNNYAVTCVGEDAFLNKTDITSIVIPQTITLIDDGAFAGCSNIDKVYISSIESWCEIEFEGTNPLVYAKHLIIDGKEQKDIVIPEGVEYLNDWVFKGFVGIYSVTLPSTLRWLDRAFGGCSNLSLVICNKTTPPYVEDYGWRPFNGISSKAKLIVPKGTISDYYSHPVWGNSFKRISEDLNHITFEDPDVKSICVLNWDTNGDGELNYDEAESVTDLGNAFIENRKVDTFRELIYFSGLKSIANKTFHDCRNLSLVLIPENVETICSKAFHRCVSLKSIEIPSNVKTIAGEAFDGCTGLTSVSLANGVETIGPSSFFSCTSLNMISIPETVQNIGTLPFPRTIESIEINKHNQKYESPQGSNCIIERDTKTVIFGNNNPTIPTGTLHIGANAFSGCSFSEIVLPKSVESIENAAFMSCGNLTAISLPKNITELTESVFKGCGSLSNIELPRNITIIGSSAFSGCASLASVVLPNSLSAIGSSAFYNCTSLSKVESQIPTPFEIINVFTGISPESELHVPYGKKSLYESTKGWNVFGEIIEAEPQQFDLNIAAVGNGSAMCDGKTVRNQSLSIKVTEGSSSSISLYPDTGYRVASIKVNGQDALSQVNDNQLVIPVTDNTNVAIVFEAITHTLTIKATGNGSVVYNETMIRDNSSSFIVNDGTSATVKFTSDTGYKIKSVKLNAVDITSSVKNNQYTISNVNSDNSLEVEFEAITHTLTIKATGNGSVEFYEMTIRDNSCSFTVNDGTSAVFKFVSDAGYKIKSVKLNSTDITSSLNESQYTISYIKSDCTLEVEFEAITHTLSVVATGNGNVDYNGIVIRNQSQSYFVQEGSSIIFSFIPDAGFRVGNVKVNNTDVTASVENNSYTISNITANVTLTVTYEAIPPNTYTFTISAVGNGIVTYEGNVLRGETSSFTVVEGTNVVVKFAADEGFRLKSVKQGNIDVTSSVVNSQYTINNIKANTSLEVAFESIPTYTLTVKATGNGVASYEGMVVCNQLSSFVITEGTDATITFIPDNGYKIKSVKVDEVNVTAIVVNDQFTVSKVSKDTSLEVEFEAKNYTLAITSKGNGSVNYEGNTVRSKTSTFTLAAWTSATVSFASDDGYRLMSAKLNGTNIMADVFDNQYTIVDINHDTSLEVEFAEDVTDITYNGVDYKVVSYIDATLNVTGSDNGLALSVPATILYKNRLWKVVGVEADAFNDCSELAAIEWSPETKFNGKVGNPNLLLYVKDKQYASEEIQNVVVNGDAEEIVLMETESGNNFYCPKAFMAKKVAYEHNYSMKSGYNTCQGWETIALPFDVTKIQRLGGTELLPYQAWTQGNEQRPFWLYSLTELGWKAESSITANTPYIISMPNNEMYNPLYNISGIVQFIGENVQIKASDNLVYGKDNNKKFIPSFQNQKASQDFFVLNVNNLSFGSS